MRLNTFTFTVMEKNVLLRIRVYALPLYAQTAPQHFVNELNKAELVQPVDNFLFVHVNDSVGRCAFFQPIRHEHIDLIPMRARI